MPRPTPGAPQPAPMRRPASDPTNRFSHLNRPRSATSGTSPSAASTLGFEQTLSQAAGQLRAPGQPPQPTDAARLPAQPNSGLAGSLATGAVPDLSAGRGLSREALYSRAVDGLSVLFAASQGGGGSQAISDDLLFTAYAETLAALTLLGQTPDNQIAASGLPAGGGTLQAPTAVSAALPPSALPAVGAPATGRSTGAAQPVPGGGAPASAGPVAPSQAFPPGALALAAFPRPPADNGRGIHWIPTTHSTKEVVDRFVREAKEMHMTWVVLLNNGTNIGDNDYLVKKLVENGIMPVMRIYTPNGQPIGGDLGALVRHYKGLGVSYFQLYNEPNLISENPDGQVNIQRYVDWWIRDAKIVVENGGLPGFLSLAPGGNVDDVEFLKAAFDEVKRRGETKVLDHAWLSLHNYTLNHPLEYEKDSNGFLKFRFYDKIIREKLGRSMPIISTEGGTHVGSHNDSTFPAITPDMQVQMMTNAYRYMEAAEPYYFANTYWIIANEEGGGHDAGFTNHALIRKDGASPVVAALKALPPGGRR